MFFSDLSSLFKLFQFEQSWFEYSSLFLNMKGLLTLSTSKKPDKQDIFIFKLQLFFPPQENLSISSFPFFLSVFLLHFTTFGVFYYSLQRQGQFFRIWKEYLFNKKKLFCLNAVSLKFKKYITLKERSLEQHWKLTFFHKITFSFPKWFSKDYYVMSKITFSNFSFKNKYQTNSI